MTIALFYLQLLLFAVQIMTNKLYYKPSLGHLIGKESKEQYGRREDFQFIRTSTSSVHVYEM